ncbi:hypothetical protein VAWG001_11300 [Aeromonas dhakensis]|nr:hypothetical protein VAWG001_11300 [Aeromonas dhakensis]
MRGEAGGQGALDEIPQQVAGKGAVGMGCQMQMSQIVHEGGNQPKGLPLSLADPAALAYENGRLAVRKCFPP